MTCWIKPTDITGEKFIFGQTNQGVHNGIRNNSYLHQAHWGADTNGATQLAPTLPLMPMAGFTRHLFMKGQLTRVAFTWMGNRTGPGRKMPRMAAVT